jgi:hypothetical protein
MAKSIKTCIKTLLASGDLTQATADDVMGRISEYVKEGYSAKEANDLAIGDAIDEQRDELRSVYSQIAFDAANDPLLSDSLPRKEKSAKAPKVEAPVVSAPKYTEEERKVAQDSADDYGGEIVWQEGPLALIRGYGALTGNPVYIPAWGTYYARVGVDSYTGSGITAEEKAKLVEVKDRLEQEADEKHAKSPFPGVVDGKIANSRSVKDEVASITDGWAALLGLDAGIYLTTLDDVKADRNKFTGPYRAIGSAALDPSNSGSMRRMENGQYYIVFKDSTSMTKQLETIAHELGHIHQREVFANAPEETKLQLQLEFEKWKQGQNGKSERDLIHSLRARSSARANDTKSSTRPKSADDMRPYWKSFSEWYADQVSRWAVSSDKPLGVVEKYFSKIAAALKSFYSKITNAGYLPNETFAQYLENSKPTIAWDMSESEATNTSTLEDSRTEEIGEEAFRKVLDRNISRYEGGFDSDGKIIMVEPPPLKKTMVAARLKKAINGLDSDKLTDEEFAAEIEKLYQDLVVKRLDKKTSGRKRARGALWIRTKLLNAVRNGEISQREADMAEWFIKQNPALVDDLGISIKEQKNPTDQTRGHYEGNSRVFTLIVGMSADMTASHEILHHLERLMPEEFQDAIRMEWINGISRELKDPKITEGRKFYLEKALQAQLESSQGLAVAAMMQYKSGVGGKDAYQWLNPSEYWAVNGAHMLRNRFDAQNGSVWLKMYVWLTEVLEKAKDLFGLQSNAAIIRALDHMINESEGGAINTRKGKFLGVLAGLDLEDDAGSGYDGADYNSLPLKVKAMVNKQLAKTDHKDAIKSLIKEFSGTPWARQAIAGALARQGIDDMLAGKEIDYYSVWGAPSTQNVANDIKAKGEEAIWLHLYGNFIGNPDKPVNSVNSSFLDCEPSKDCATYCYAALGINFPANVIKAEMVAWAIKKDPVRAGKMIATEYKAMPDFEAGKALRLFDKGDGNTSWLPLLDEMKRQGVRAHIFTKRPDFLRQLTDDYHLRLLSVDKTNFDLSDKNPDLPLAVVYGGTQEEADWINKNKDRVQVVLPVILRGGIYLNDEQINRLDRELRPHVCPVDKGAVALKPTIVVHTNKGVVKHFPITKAQPLEIVQEKAEKYADKAGGGTLSRIKNDNFSCQGCDKGGGLGCYHKQVTKDILAKISGAVTPNELESAIKELKNVARGLSGSEQDSLLTELRALLGKAQRGFDPATETGLPGSAESESGSATTGNGRSRKSSKAGQTLGDIGAPSTVPTATGGVGPTWGPQTPINLNGQTGQPAWGINKDDRLTKLVYTFQNKHVDTKDVLKAIDESGGVITDQSNPYQKEELFHKRTEKRTSDFMDNELKPLLHEMRDNKVDRLEFEEYLHARHAKEANDHIRSKMGMVDGGSGMLDQEADDYFQNLDPVKKAIYEKLAVRVDKIIDNTRNLLVTGGLESQGTINEWKQQFQHYIPLNREDMEEGTGIGQGFSVRGSFSKARTGSSRDVVDILSNIAQQRDRAIVRVEKNRIATALYALAYMNKNPAFWEADKVPMIQTVDKNGQIISVPDPNYKSDPNVIVARIKNAKGEIKERAVVFNKHDPRALRMATALKNLDQEQMNVLLSGMAVYTRWIAAVNTQYNPVFVVVNGVRDLQAGLLNLSSTPLRGKQAQVFKNFAIAIYGIWQDLRNHRKGLPPSSPLAQYYEQLQLAGGTTGFRDMFGSAAERSEKQIERELDPDWWVKTGWGKVVSVNGLLKAPEEFLVSKVGGYFFNVLSDMNEVAENAMRLAVFKTYLDIHGANAEEKAASLAKNITVNFNRKGSIGREINAGYAFFNAAMQGTTRMAETLRGPAGKQIIVGGITIGVAQALALAFMGFDDDDPPEFVRQRSLIIPIGDKRHIDIPMPLGLHVLPNIGRLITDTMLGRKKPGESVAEMMAVMAEAFNPIGSAGRSFQTLAPTLFDPVIALLENQDWNGRPIYRQSYDKNEPGYLRTKDTATPFAKGTAKAMNDASVKLEEVFGSRKKGLDNVAGAFSPTPDQIDYLIGQLTGGVGREASKAWQFGSSMATGEDVPTHKIPLVGRFYGQAKGQSHEANKFYDRLSDLDRLDRELKQRKLAKLPITDLVQKTPEVNLIKLSNKVQFQLSQLRKRKRDLVAKNDKDGVKIVESQITDLMQKFNTKYEQVTEATAEAN